MDTKRVCPSCGKPVESNAPQGLCPECLMKAAFPTGTETGGRQISFVPPKIEELTAKFPQLEILEFIGQGGMGAVYKARQKQLDRIVALKILPPQAAGGPGFAERFAREARALAKLNHPHIVTLYEFGQADGLFYFLMEFVDGTNLRQVLNAGRLAPKEALAIVPQICEALQFAHENGIVHRDIKPENILLSRGGQVKIADFGVAKIVAEGMTEAASTEAAPSGELTEAGSAIGTPQYMAPEQIKNSAEVDHRADIYSLGVVFYQMLTGELPSGKIEAPSKKVQVDVRLDEVVLRALEKKPELRYQEASVLKTQVETIAQTVAGAATNSEAFIQAALARDYSLNITQWLERGWKLVVSDFWPIVGITALIWMLAKLAGSSVAGIVVGTPLMGGLWLYFLNRIRGKTATLETAFSGFKVAFLQMVLVGLVTTVLTVLGFLCLIVPGIYLLVAWMFALPLVADKGLEFWPAMELSRKIVSRHWWTFLWFGIVLVLMHIVGAVCFYVGLFVAVPLCLAALAYAYEDIFGPVAGLASGGAQAASTQPASSKAIAGIALGVTAAVLIIAFLGMLAGIAIPNFVRARHRAIAFREQQSAKVKAIVHIHSFTVYTMNYPSVIYAATVPSGCELKGTANSGNVFNMAVPIGSPRGSPGETEIRWNFPMIKPEPPLKPGQLWKPQPPPKLDSFEQMQAEGAAMKAQLQELQDQGPIAVVFGEPKRLFSITNAAGDVHEGFLELVVKGTNESSGATGIQAASDTPASTGNNIPQPPSPALRPPNSFSPPPVAPTRPLRTLPSRSKTIPTESGTLAVASNDLPLTPEQQILLIQAERLKAIKDGDPISQVLPPRDLLPLRSETNPVTPLGDSNWDSTNSAEIEFASVTDTSSRWKPIPAETAVLDEKLRAFAESYLSNHDMRDTNTPVEFGKLQWPYIEKIDESLKGTMAEPLVNEHRELLKEVEAASKAGEKDRVTAVGEELGPIGIEIERMIKGMPICQLRWVATDGDVNSAVDIVTNRDGAKTFRLSKRVALDEHEVKGAGFTEMKPDKKALSIYLYPPAGKRFSAEAPKHFGHPLAVVWQGQVVAVLNISEYSEEHVVLSGSLSDSDSQELLDILNRQMQTNPRRAVSTRSQQEPASSTNNK